MFQTSPSAVNINEQPRIPKHKNDENRQLNRGKQTNKMTGDNEDCSREFKVFLFLKT